jgi:hypothetical protein
MTACVHGLLRVVLVLSLAHPRFTLLVLSRAKLLIQSNAMTFARAIPSISYGELPPTQVRVSILKELLVPTPTRLSAAPMPTQVVSSTTDAHLHLSRMFNPSSSPTKARRMPTLSLQLSAMVSHQSHYRLPTLIDALPTRQARLRHKQRQRLLQKLLSLPRRASQHLSVPLSAV